MSNTKIVLNRQSDLILDNANITAPVGIVVADIAGLESALLSIDTKESADISAEASSRISGDASLAAGLSTELVDRAAAISSEESSRIAGDASLASNLSSEASNRVAGDDSLAADLSTELSNRVAGDVSVTAAMSAEISTRIVAETSLQNNIDAESSINLVRDQAEESRAIAAETSLAADLDAEQSRAESAEASLNAKVENVISNVDPAALDSLTEIVGAFQSADGDLNGAITALSSTATAAVDNEASIRLAADQSLAGDLSSEIADREAAVSLEEAARISGDASVNADLSTEIEARISDVNAEQARAESAEAVLTAGLSTELVDRAAAVSSEASSRVAGDDSLAAGLSSELVARASADTAEASTRLASDNSIAAGLSSELVARASAVSAEASSRVAGDTSIAAGLSSELVARASGDASLAATLSAANSSIEAMPYTDGTTIIVDAATNTIQLKTEVAAPSGGTRTFSGLINVAAQPASLAGFGDLTLVTKAYVSGQVSSEASTRLAADNSIAAGLSSELVARASADTAEASTRLAADNSIAAGLSSELVNRASADTSIAANLSTEKSRIDAILLASDADKDSFAEIVSLINSVDTTNDQAFASYVLSNDAALSTELVARASADSSLATQISSELSTANASIEGALSSEISDRGVAIDNEASIRLAADISLESEIGTESLVDWNAPQMMTNYANIFRQNSTLLRGLYEASQLNYRLNKYGDQSGNIPHQIYIGADYGLGYGLYNSFKNFVVSLTEPFTSTQKSLLQSTFGGSVKFGEDLGYAVLDSVVNLDPTLGDFDPYSVNGGFASLTDIVSNFNPADGLYTQEQIDLLSSYLNNWYSAMYNLFNLLIRDKGWSSKYYLEETLVFDNSGNADHSGTVLGYEAFVTDIIEFRLRLEINSNNSSLSASLSSEISRAEAAEDSLEVALSTEVSYLLANTDLTSIDSFAEVSDALAAQVSDFTAIYFKKASFSGSINGTNADFTLADAVRSGSETVYLNGLLQEAGVEYTVAGSVITFATAPSTGDKVVIYGVY